MLYFNRTKNVTYPHIYSLRTAFPSVSFPELPSEADLAPLGVVVLTPTPSPSYDPWTHRLVEGTPEQRNGQWHQTWTLEPVVHTPEEEAERLEQAKAAKLSEIKASFTAAESDGFVVSSLSFRADATRRSIGDIEGLIDLVSSGAMTAPVMFRDYDNGYHDLTLDQLNTLRLEAKGRGPLLYAHKWELEAAVDAAQTVDDVQAISTGSWLGTDNVGA